MAELTDLAELWLGTNSVELSCFDRVAAVLSAFWADAESPAGFENRELLEVEDRLGVLIPAVLREGLARFGSSPGMNGQDRFFGANELTIRDGYLQFRIENQGCAIWAVRVDGGNEDPAVHVSYDGGSHWSRSYGAVSEFFENVALSEALVAPVSTDYANLEDDPELLLRELGCRRLPTARFELANPGGQEVRFYASPGLLLADFACTELWAVALSPQVLQRFRQSTSLDWAFLT